MKKIKLWVLFAGLVSLTSCSKKQNELKEVNGAKADIVEFSALKGVPAFADLGLKNSRFTIVTNSLGELKFEMEHADNALFSNNRAALFTGKVALVKSNLTGNAYMYQGLGGIQIGMDLTDPSTGRTLRYQIRNYTAMHDECELLDENADVKSSTNYTRSIIQDLSDIRIPEMYHSSILLEKNGDYELIDMSAMDKIYADLNPQSLQLHCGVDQSMQMNDENTKRGNGYRSNVINLNFYTLKNNDFGTFTYNDFVDRANSTYACLKEIDSKKVNTYTFTNVVMVSTTYNSSRLAWDNDAANFLTGWKNHHNEISKNWTDSKAKNAINVLCVGSTWNGVAGMAILNTFGNRSNNKCIISAQNGVSGYTAPHEVSHVLGAVHENNIFTVNKVNVQDLMRTNKIAQTVSLYHLDATNKNAVLANFTGY